LEGLKQTTSSGELQVGSDGRRKCVNTGWKVFSAVKNTFEGMIAVKYLWASCFKKMSFKTS
jgi:hypothetical protein